MSDNENTSGDVNAVPEGASTNNDDKVAYTTYKKVLTEKKNIQEKMRGLQDQLDVFNTEKQTSEQTKLEAQGEYKKILEMKANELNSLKGDNETLAKELTKTWKKQAFFGKLKGSLKKTEYEQFIDFNSIAINPETQEINGESVDVAVNSFLENYGDLVNMPGARTLPSQAATGTVPKDHRNMTQVERAEALKNALTNVITR